MANMTAKDKKTHRYNLEKEQRELILSFGEGIIDVINSIHDRINKGWTKGKARENVGSMHLYCLYTAIQVESFNVGVLEVINQVILLEAKLTNPFFFNPLRHDYNKLTLIRWNDDKRRTKSQVLSLLTRLTGKIRGIFDERGS